MTAYFRFPTNTFLSFSRCDALVPRARLGRGHCHVYLCRSRSTHAPFLPYPFHWLPRSAPSRAHSPAQHIRTLIEHVRELLLLLQAEQYTSTSPSCKPAPVHCRAIGHTRHTSITHARPFPDCIGTSGVPLPLLPPTFPIHRVSFTFLHHRQPQTFFSRQAHPTLPPPSSSDIVLCSSVCARV